MNRAFRLTWLCAVVALTSSSLLASCSKKVEGPAPTVEPPSAAAEPPPVDPEIVCRDQLTTEVTLHGERLSPVPIDIPDAPKAALPTVELTRSAELDGSDAAGSDRVIYSGDPDADPTNVLDGDGELITAEVDGEDKPLLQWHSQREMRFVVTQSLTLGERAANGADSREQGMLAEGVWDVAVRNQNGQQAESLGGLTVIDKPELDELAPGIVCLSQQSRTITLDGETFLRNEEDQVVLEVDGVDEPFAVELSDCTAIAHEGLDAEVCNSASVELAVRSIGVGLHPLTLQNPETAACRSEEERSLRVVPPPTVDRVRPPMACVAEHSRELVIEGRDFLRIDGDAPLVSIDGQDFVVEDMGGCEALETQSHDVELCESLTVSVAMNQLDPGLYEVTVQNPDPAGCDATATGVLRIVPPPTIDEVQPALVCLDDGARVVEVHGSDFLVVDGEQPAVSVDDLTLDAAAIEPQGCADLDVQGLDVARCDTLVLTLAEGSVGVGMPTVRVENPVPAGCSDTRGDVLAVVAGPTISGAEPALLCTEDGSQMITVSGTGFLTVDGQLPAVTVNGTAVSSVDSAGGCAAAGAPGLSVEACTSLAVTLAQGFLAEGLHSVEVQNPDPAGCAASRADALTVPPLLSIAAVTPLNVCRDTVDPAFALTLSGQGFLDVDGTLPTVTFDGTAATPTLDDCSELAVDGQSGVSSCSSLAMTVDLTASLTANAGMIPILVTNEQAPACTLSSMAALNVVDPPTVTMIDVVDAPSDTDVCSDIGFTLTITGTGFVEGTTVTLANDDASFTTDASSITVDSDTQIRATFEDGLEYNASDTDYDLLVASASGCAATPVLGAIDVNPTPLVFFVDPPVVYNAITVDVTVFAAGLSADSMLDTIEIIGAGDVATALTVVDNTKSTRIVAQVPDEDPVDNMPFDPGDYTVRVTSVLGCSDELPGALSITATLDDDLLTTIAPSYVSSTKDTAVTITGDGFSPVPRVYLSSGTGAATPLRAVEVIDTTTITAVVPAGLAAGAYDLIVVNPGGSVDVLAGGLTVSADEPAVISALVPASLPASSVDTVSVLGSGFVDGAEIELDCRDGVTSEGVSGTGETVAADGSSIDVTLDLSAVSAGAICVVRVTNPDGAFFDYSAFSVTNASLNLSAWSDATNLATGRRGVGAFAGRPTNTSRFLYAVGGDSGVASMPAGRGTLLTSVEAARVDLFGAMGTWSVQRNDLSNVVIGGSTQSAPRTQAGIARIGRFAYLVGGHDGTAATDSLLRAQVLDPTVGPEVEEVDAALGDLQLGTGLGEGLYYYRIAAVFPGDDPSNPGGESLAGELLPVQLPQREEGIVLELRVTDIPGAHGYRIYRSPGPGDSADSVELLGEITCGASPTDVCDCAGTPEDCRFVDDGTRTTNGETPMPSGSLGVWHAVDGTRCAGADCALATAREGLATVAVRDPSETDDATDTYYLYAFGGRDGGGSYLASYEVATITVTLATDVAPESQEVADWAAGADDLLSPRADLGAWVMTAENSAAIRDSATPDDVWIYVGGGRTTGDAADRNMQAALRGSAAALGAFQDTDDLSNDLFGLGVGASNGQLYTFGGQTTASGTSAALCDGGGGCGALPDLQPGAFNALGPASTDRMFMGHAQESAFFFLVGGHDGDTTLTSTEQTVQ